jgi:integrase
MHQTTHNRLRAVDLPRISKAGYHHDGGGLYLQVREGKNGITRSWVFRYTRLGKARNMGLGPLHTISLSEARVKAREARKLRLEGVDPVGDRKAQRAAQRVSEATAMTFKQCAEAYIAAHQAGWRNPKHAAQWTATLGAYAYPIFGTLPVQAVDVGLVMKAIEPIWSAKTVTASRVRGRIESVLDWATARGYRQGENPARWNGHLENLLPSKTKVHRVEHHPALPHGEISGFMADLRQKEGVPARALEFAILTAARTGEVIGARWDEMNLTEKLWIVPATRMKAGKAHRVPLSDAALTILERMREIRRNDFVFPGRDAGKPISGIGFSSVLQRMKRGDLTPHGFRSTFMDWAAEQTNFPAEMRDMALAHTVSDKVEAAYRRGDLFERRREMMAAWAQFCEGASGGNVVAMRGVGR